MCSDDEDLMSGMQHHDLAIPYSLQPGQLVRLQSKYDASQEHYGAFACILLTLMPLRVPLQLVNIYSTHYGVTSLHNGMESDQRESCIL